MMKHSSWWKPFYQYVWLLFLLYVIHVVCCRGLNLAGNLPKMVPVSLVIAPKWSLARGNQDAPRTPKPQQDMLDFGRFWSHHSSLDGPLICPFALCPLCHVILHLVQGDFCKQLQCISLDWPLESAHPDAPYHINHSPRNPPKTMAAWIWMISWTGETCQL